MSALQRLVCCRPRHPRQNHPTQQVVQYTREDTKGKKGLDLDLSPTLCSSDDPIRLSMSSNHRSDLSTVRRRHSFEDVASEGLEDVSSRSSEGNDLFVTNYQCEEHFSLSNTSHQHLLLPDVFESPAPPSAATLVSSSTLFQGQGVTVPDIPLDDLYSAQKKQRSPSFLSHASSTQSTVKINNTSPDSRPVLGALSLSHLAESASPSSATTSTRNVEAQVTAVSAPSPWSRLLCRSHADINESPSSVEPRAHSTHTRKSRRQRRSRSFHGVYTPKIQQRRCSAPSPITTEDQKAEGSPVSHGVLTPEKTVAKETTEPTPEPTTVTPTDPPKNENGNTKQKPFVSQQHLLHQRRSLDNNGGKIHITKASLVLPPPKPTTFKSVARPPVLSSPKPLPLTKGYKDCSQLSQQDRDAYEVWYQSGLLRWRPANGEELVALAVKDALSPGAKAALFTSKTEELLSATRSIACYQEQVRPGGTSAEPQGSNPKKSTIDGAITPSPGKKKYPPISDSSILGGSPRPAARRRSSGRMQGAPIVSLFGTPDKPKNAATEATSRSSESVASRIQMYQAYASDYKVYMDDRTLSSKQQQHQRVHVVKDEKEEYEDSDEDAASI